MVSVVTHAMAMAVAYGTSSTYYTLLLVIIVWSEQEHATFSKFAKEFFLANLACDGE